ncbi:hypothetical protein GCM10009592_14790 [Brachybacterium rhamnosum]|uniref:Type II toxin-antitoxin system VapC family toxin n=1 Tax=Brachybacterium rhamnosum TaxID=173361 RepID=A0ABW4PY18_9MICO
MSKSGLVYLDTSVIVAVLLNEDRAEDTVEVLESFKNGVAECVISPLVIAEIYGTPKIREVTRSGMTPSLAKKSALDSIRRVDKFLGHLESWDACILVENTRRQGVMVRDFGLRYQLKGPDAMHLAAAIEFGCSHLFTFDRGLLKVGNEQGVEVSQPYLLDVSNSSASDSGDTAAPEGSTDPPAFLSVIPGLSTYLQ